MPSDKHDTYWKEMEEGPDFKLCKREALIGAAVTFVLVAYVVGVFSVDAVSRWKPHPEPYRYVTEACGVDAAEAVMIAVHSWDVAGAKRAGLMTGYAARLEGAFVPLFPEPDVQGGDLADVAKALIALQR